MACILLNKTTSDAVRRVIWELFELIPTPEAALAVPEADIARIIKPLGLTKRAAYIQRMSAQYLGGAWRSVAELAGCGQYATDAYALFCTGDWRAMAPPADKELIKYFRFLQARAGAFMCATGCAALTCFARTRRQTARGVGCRGTRPPRVSASQACKHAPAAVR